MLGSSLERLLSISSPSTENAEAATDRSVFSSAGSFADEIISILVRRNGFFAFEGALRFFPYRSVPISYGILEWNSSELWRQEYGDMTNGCFFFAEDIFGGQFCCLGGRICQFDPETGQCDALATSFEEWAELILSNHEVLTGFRLAHEWQTRFGQLKGRDRLVPKVPFVAGGDFSVLNLAAIDSVRGMRSRGGLARQIRDLPDGAKIRFTIVD